MSKSETLKRKGVCIILDGLGDHPSAKLQQQTPLQTAQTPTMNQWAQNGICGMVDPLFPGVSVGTHTGTALLMGMPRRQVTQLHRGPVEAAGIGLDLQPGDLAIRCNFATLSNQNNSRHLIDRRAGRIRNDTDKLAQLLQNIELNNGIFATLQPATHHRAVLHLWGKPLSAEISDTDPGTGHMYQGILPCKPHDVNNITACETAAAVNQFIAIAQQRLGECAVNQQRHRQGLLAANAIITRGAGLQPEVTTLLQHYGISGAVVAGERTVLGLAKLMGYHITTMPSFTAHADTDLAAKVAATIAALQQHDLVFLHIKATDTLAHDCLAAEKAEFLQQIDTALAPLLDENIVVAVTGDHTTDSNSGRHTGDPVPTLLYVPGGRKDHCTQFDEPNVMQGGLGRITASALITSMIDAMGRMRQFQPHERELYF